MLPAESGATCDHCGKPSICRFGKDKVPLCLEHFEIVMEGVGKLMRRLVRMFTPSS